MAFRITALLTALLFATPSVAQPAPVEPRRLFLGPVTEEGIAPLMKGLREAIANHEDIVYIEIDSPGGSVSAGLQLQALMRKAEKAGVETVCLVDGHAASMAGFLLQECDVRMMTRRSDILYHEVSITFPEIGRAHV